MNIAKTFGQLLCQERLNRSLSQEELAELAGLHRNAVGLIERGERVPSLETLFSIAKGLNVPASDLLKKMEKKEGDS